MILVRNRLIIGAVVKTIKLVFKFLYKIIALLNLQLPLLVALVGLVMFLVGAFDGGGATLVVFGLVFAVSVVLSVIGLIKKLLGFGGEKVKKSKGMQIVEDTSVSPKTPEQNVGGQAVVDNVVNSPVYVEPKPQYFRVKQNPNYVMAEYPDRYELFKLSGGNMIKIRTDYK